MEKIKGGYYLKPRCIEKSDISKKPPHIRETWEWLLGHASHKDNGKLQRGWWVGTYEDIKEGLAWYVGWRKCTYSDSQIETATKHLKRTGRITTTRTTRGLKIYIEKYDYYQDPENYTENHNEKPTRTARYNKNEQEERSISINTNKASLDDILLVKETWKKVFGKNPVGGAKIVDYPISRLIKAYTAKRVAGAIVWAESNRSKDKYIPVFNNPLDLEKKWNSIVARATNRSQNAKELDLTKV